MHSTFTHSYTSTQTVAANMSGELHLRMEAEEVTATTYFKDLQNHQFGGSITKYPLYCTVWVGMLHGMHYIHRTCTEGGFQKLHK